MKKYIFITVAILNALTFANANDKVGDITKLGDTSYMLVREFNTPEQNDNFQRNIAIMRQHAQLIEGGKEKLAKTTDEKEKKNLEAKIKQIEDEFNTNDLAMQKAYAFSSNRQYRLVYLKTNICVPLTRDELSSLKSSDGKELDPLLISEKNNTSLYRIKAIDGVEENGELQRILGFSLSRKGEIDQMRIKLAQTTDPQEQLKISQNLASLQKALDENDAQMRKKYEIKSKVNYVIEVAHSKLYLILTPEEVLKIQAQAIAEGTKKTATTK